MPSNLVILDSVICGTLHLIVVCCMTFSHSRFSHLWYAASNCGMLHDIQSFRQKLECKQATTAKAARSSEARMDGLLIDLKHRNKSSNSSNDPSAGKCTANRVCRAEMGYTPDLMYL